MKVWFCRANNAVIPDWVAANCKRGDEPCPWIVSVCENDVPPEAMNFEN